MLDIARNCVLSERWEHAMNILIQIAGKSK